MDEDGHHTLNMRFKADKNSYFIPSTSSVKLTKGAVSSLMDLRVIVNVPLHMSDVRIIPLMHAVPQYRMLTGDMANNWNSFVRKNTFTVGKISSDFNSIQACLNAVPVDSIITVHPGIYNETLSVTKSVTLMAAAAGLSNTFLTTTVNISASHVTLDGFTFQSSSSSETLLRIEGRHVSIQNCRFAGQYMVDRPFDQHKVELAISCHNCHHVKILNNIFSHCMFAVSLDKVKHFTIRSNLFSYGYTSVVVLRSAEVINMLGNMFKFNRAVMWLDRSLEPSMTMTSFADNVYYNNLQSHVCLQNQITHDQKPVYFIPKFGELKDLECHHLNVLSTTNTTTKDVMMLPDHVIFKGWCGSQVEATSTPGIEGQIYTPSGCILLLGSVVATVYPQGT